MTTTCDASAVVTQGPEWLAQLYLCPPWWVNPVLAIIGVTTLLVVLYRLRERGWTIDLEEQRQMLAIAWTVAGVLVATLAMSRWAGQPYLVDVGVGVLVGWGGVTAAQTDAVAQGVPVTFPGLRERLTAAWAGLFVLSMVSLALVEPSSVPMLGAARWYLAILGAAMMLYNVRELEEGEA